MKQKINNNNNYNNNNNNNNVIIIIKIIHVLKTFKSNEVKRITSDKAFHTGTNAHAHKHTKNT